MNDIFVTERHRDRMRVAVYAIIVVVSLFLARLPALIPPAPSWLVVLSLLAILILCIAVPFLLVHFLRGFLSPPQQLEIDADGIVITRGKHIRRYPWDDIADVIIVEKNAGKDTGTAVGQQLGGAFMGGFIGGVISYFVGEVFGEFLASKETHNTTTITIRTGDHQTYKLDRRMSSWVRLLDVLPESVARAWKESDLRRLEADQAVIVLDHKGERAATLTPASVGNHQHTISWDAVKSVTYEYGQLAVRTTVPGLASMRFQIDGVSVRGRALAEIIRARSPAVRAELERKQKFADKPL